MTSSPTPAAGLVAVGVELGVGEALEDRSHRCALGHAAVSVDREPVAERLDRGVAAGIGLFVAAVRTIGVGECFPTLDEDTKFVERQHASVVKHQVATVGELVATTRIGPCPASSRTWATPIEPAARAAETCPRSLSKTTERIRWVVSAPDELTVA